MSTYFSCCCTQTSTLVCTKGEFVRQGHGSSLSYISSMGLMCNHKLPLSKLKTLPVISLHSSFLIWLSFFSFRLPLLMSHFVPRPQLAHPSLRRAPACQAPVLCCRLLFLSSPFSSKLIRQLFAPAGRKSFGSSRPLLGEQWKVKSFTPGYRAAGLLLDRRTSAARERERGREN